jgi:hypothetical protein
MFIIPSSEVVLLGAAVMLALASLQVSIGDGWLYFPRFKIPDGGIGDEQLTHHPALTSSSNKRFHGVSARRIRRESTSRTSAVWALATLAILVLLTTVLMMGIAISA